MFFLRDAVIDLLYFEDSFGNLARVLTVFNEEKNQENQENLTSLKQWYTFLSLISIFEIRNLWTDPSNLISFMHCVDKTVKRLTNCPAVAHES